MDSIQTPLKKYFIKNVCLLIVLTLMILTGCSGKKTILFKSTNEIKLDEATLNAENNFSEPQAIIRNGNILSVSNVQNEDAITGSGTSTPLEIRYLVDVEGNIKLPLIGNMHVAGLTVRETEKIITEKYKASTLIDPLFVVKILNMKVSLLGEFAKQGNYELEQENVLLTESIAEAGGFNARADKSKIKIIRGDHKSPKVYLVDLTDIQTLASNKLYLQDGDIVYCQPRKIFSFTEQAAPFFSYLTLGSAIVNIIFLLTR